MLKTILLFLTAGIATVDAVTLCDFSRMRTPVPCWRGDELEQNTTYCDNGLQVCWNTHIS